MDMTRDEKKHYIVNNAVDMLYQISQVWGLPYIPRDLIREIATEYSMHYIPTAELNTVYDDFEARPIIPPPPKSNVINILEGKKKRKK